MNRWRVVVLLAVTVVGKKRLQRLNPKYNYDGKMIEQKSREAGVQERPRFKRRVKRAGGGGRGRRRKKKTKEENGWNGGGKWGGDFWKIEKLAGGRKEGRFATV